MKFLEQVLTEKFVKSIARGGWVFQIRQSLKIFVSFCLKLLLNHHLQFITFFVLSYQIHTYLYKDLGLLKPYTWMLDKSWIISCVLLKANWYNFLGIKNGFTRLLCSFWSWIAEWFAKKEKVPFADCTNLDTGLIFFHNISNGKSLSNSRFRIKMSQAIWRTPFWPLKSCIVSWNKVCKQLMLNFFSLNVK